MEIFLFLQFKRFIVAECANLKFDDYLYKYI